MGVKLFLLVLVFVLKSIFSLSTQVTSCSGNSSFLEHAKQSMTRENTRVVIGKVVPVALSGGTTFRMMEIVGFIDKGGIADVGEHILADSLGSYRLNLLPKRKVTNENKLQFPYSSM